jgi:hypothetical protein
VPKHCQWQFSNVIGNARFWEISSISLVLATMSFVIVIGINTRVLRRPAMEMRAPIQRVQKAADNCLISVSCTTLQWVSRRYWPVADTFTNGADVCYYGGTFVKYAVINFLINVSDDELKRHLVPSRRGDAHPHYRKPWNLKKIVPIMNTFPATNGISLRSLSRDTAIRNSTKLPVILERLAAPLMLFRHSCSEFHGRPTNDTPPHFGSDDFQRAMASPPGDRRSYCCQVHQPHLAIPFVCEFVSALMATVGPLHLDASGWQMLRGAMIVFSAILQFFVLKHKRRPHGRWRIAIV